MSRIIQVVTGFILLFAIEILRVYFIMPFPGSQRNATIDLAYFLHEHAFYLRTIGLLIIVFPVLYFLIKGTTAAKAATVTALIGYLAVIYFFNFRFMADKMFYQPENKIFADAATNKVSNKSLVLGVYLGGQARAYPIEIIGYHHQVRDTIGNVPVMITYCTVCRTGRVFSPLVDGKPEEFRLVGMDHFNAMFEDATTETWWRQVNGEAVAGPLKGKTLEEIPSQQMTLRAWLEVYPQSEILQPDSAFKKQYEGLAGFDEGTIDSGLEGRDSISWKDKSWVVGVQVGFMARAYDWNDLLQRKVINDTLSGAGIVIAVEPDSATFHVWSRDSLQFERLEKSGLRDLETKSTWNWQGKAIDGSLAGATLKPIQSYQEFWHSWATFHPHTTRYVSDK